MYSIRWLEEALDELAAIWLEGDSALRAAITAATNQIDAALSEDPNSKGESRANGRRIDFIAPLGVQFRVDESRMEVTVVQVWLFRKRRR
jgi:hypothetical protein